MLVNSMPFIGIDFLIHFRRQQSVMAECKPLNKNCQKVLRFACMSTNIRQPLCKLIYAAYNIGIILIWEQKKIEARIKFIGFFSSAAPDSFPSIFGGHNVLYVSVWCEAMLRQAVAA